MSDGATVVGGVKNDPSSKVSRKSLGKLIHFSETFTGCDVKRNGREHRKLVAQGLWLVEEIPLGNRQRPGSVRGWWRLVGGRS